MCMPCATSDEELKAVLWDAKIDHKAAPLNQMMGLQGGGLTDLRSFKSGLLSPTAALAASRDLPSFIAGLPKAELHLHIEGSLTAARAYAIAEKNNASAEVLAKMEPNGAARRRQAFTSLFPFLVEYSDSSNVLTTEQDFYDMGCDYLKRASENRVAHVEMFFDAQSHCFFDVSGDIANPAMNPGSASYLSAVPGQPQYDPNGIGPKRCVQLCVPLRFGVLVLTDWNLRSFMEV
jgi:hypothetical protein